MIRRSDYLLKKLLSRSGSCFLSVFSLLCFNMHPNKDQFLFRNPNKWYILTLTQQHFHNVRITLPGSSMQSSVPEFILKHKTSSPLTNILISINPDIVKLRCVMALKFQFSSLEKHVYDTLFIHQFEGEKYTVAGTFDVDHSCF